MDEQKSSGSTPPPGRKVPNPAGGWWFWVLMVLLFVLWFGSRTAGRQAVPYSVFKQWLAEGRVEYVLVSESEIVGTLHAPEGGEGDTSAVPEGDTSSAPEKEVGAAPRHFQTVRVPDEGLIEDLEAAGVTVEGARENFFGSALLLWLLPFTLLFFLLPRILRRASGGQMMGFGKSRAKLVPEEGTGVSFEDVAGCDEAKRELSQMVEFLRNPGRFTALGGRIPKGVLLLGPPGTGKTLLARAIAGEAEVPFFSLSGSDFVEMFVGVGAARVRDLFEQAKAKAPCIIFIDELDAIGRQRGVSMGVVNDEREQTLNQLLAEMDGFENNTGVILLAATNRPEILDKALLRSGRFDRQVVLDAPDLVGREQILGVHARGKPLAADVELREVAKMTSGMAGADLANVVNEAALLAADRGLSEIGRDELREAVERVVVGPERRSRRLEAREKDRIAFHEAGHALVATRVEHRQPVQKITIVPRGRAALGLTLQQPETERYLSTKTELRDRLTVLLGGRAAEELMCDDVSTGAASDLRTATDLARQMVCVFGMSDRLGLAHSARSTGGAYLGTEGNLTRDSSEQTAREIDEEVRDLLAQAHDRATRILTAERDLLVRLHDELLEVETLDRARFEELVGVQRSEDEPPGPSPSLDHEPQRSSS